jgi:hypothetical protein
VKIPEDKRIFCPKVICAVSQWPFYRYVFLISCSAHD